MTTLQTATSQLQASLPVFELYIVVFVAAAVICFASIFRTKQINQHDTRNGLIALLATSGAWALLQVAYLIAPTPISNMSSTWSVLLLALPLSARGSTFVQPTRDGRSITTLPISKSLLESISASLPSSSRTRSMGCTFTSMMVDQPFTHLMINHGILHWLAMGVAYGLAVVGIFMLFELFTQVDYDTRPFVALIGLTALPVILDILGAISNSFVNIGYSALGVAVFAVGVLFIYTDRFGTIQLAGQYDDPVIVLLTMMMRSVISTGARQDSFQHLKAVLMNRLPKSARSSQPRHGIEKSINIPTATRHSTSDQRETFSANNVQLGLLLVLSDVTDEERYRRRLEAQNDRLEQFTGMVSHDLRNPLNVAQGNSEIIYELLDATKTDDGYEPLSDETLDTVVTSAKTLSNTLDRMERLIDDLLVLARQGQAIDSREVVSLAAIVENCWEMVDHKNAVLVVDDDLTFAVDPDRLQQLFENLFRNAIEHGATTTIRVGAIENNGFYVEDDGPGIPEEKREDVFDSGFTTNRDGTGFASQSSKEIVEAHGWTVSVADSDEGVHALR